MRRTAALALAAALAAAVAVVPGGPSGAEEPASARLRRDLERTTERMHRAEADDAVLEDKAVRLEREVARTEAALAAVRAQVGRRARLAYTSGIGATSIEALLTSPDPDESLERVALLEAATRNDGQALTNAAVVRRRLRAQEAELADARAEQARVRRALARDAAALNRLFEAAVRAEAAEAARIAAAAERARQQRIAAEKEERRRAAAAAAARRARRAARTQLPAGLAGYACPVGPAHSFTDTWGAPRSGGRRHQGTDVFAPYGSPVYAVISGSVRTGRNRLGGIVVYLQGDDGDEYYYAHNSANAVRSGQRVATGELVGYVGTTGNAQGTPPHVHFERHPGGGSPVNPYPFLVRVC